MGDEQPPTGSVELRPAPPAAAVRKSYWWLVFLYPPAGAAICALVGVAIAYGSSSSSWFGADFDAVIYAMSGALFGFCGGLLASAIELLGRWANRPRPKASSGSPRGDEPEDQ